MSRFSNIKASSHGVRPDAAEAEETDRNELGFVRASKLEGQARPAGVVQAASLEIRDGIFGSIDMVDKLSPEQFPGALAELSALQARLAAKMAPLPGSSGNAAHEHDRLLTAQQVADRLGLSRDAIYRQKDRWPFTRRIGRAVRFSERGLGRWIAAHGRASR